MMVDGEDDIVSNEEGKRIKRDMDYIHEKLLLEKINFYNWTSQTFDESLIPEILVEPWNLPRTDLRS
jgi:hypothetical protein